MCHPGPPGALAPYHHIIYSSFFTVRFLLRTLAVRKAFEGSALPEAEYLALLTLKLLFSSTLFFPGWIATTARQKRGGAEGEKLSEDSLLP